MGFFSCTVFPTVVGSRYDQMMSPLNSSAKVNAHWQAGWLLGGSASAATWLSWSGGLLRALSEVRWLSLPDAMRRSDVIPCEALMWPWCRFGLALLHSRFPLWTLLRTFAWKCSRQPTDQIHMDGFFFWETPDPQLQTTTWFDVSLYLPMFSRL